MIRMFTAEASKTEISQEQPVRDPKRPNYIQCWNPSTGEFLGEVPVTKPKDVPAVISSARAAQQQWVNTSFEERKRVLKMIKAVCMEQRDIISKLSSQDTGKTRELIAALCSRYLRQTRHKTLRRDGSFAGRDHGDCLQGGLGV